MKLLDNKVAIIIGASSGIGRATATLFAAHGAAVVINARGEKALDEVAGEISGAGGRVHAVAGDAGVAETHARLTDAATSVFGGVDIAVNNAGGVGAAKPMAEISPDEWAYVLNVNLTSAFLGARYQIPAMLQRGGGSIVFTSSFVGTSVGIPGMSAYGAAKAGLMGLVKGITADYAVSGIRANALLPGGVDTPMAGDQAQEDWAAGLHAMKRIAEPEEIAQAALFLASDESAWISGLDLTVDGGQMASTPKL